jgi:hypothetical protein
MKRWLFFVPLCLVFNTSLLAQDTTYVSKIFSTVHIINGHSTETLEARTWRYVIAHRFGDMAGEAGGIQSFYGLDNAADIRFGFEMGITDNLMIAIGRLKGAGNPFRSILEGTAKYRFLTQRVDNKIPVSASLATTMFGSYMEASSDPASVTSFPEFAHRLAYGTQLSIARKFHDRFSAALMPTFVYRNLVDEFDQNALFSLGGAASVMLTNKLGIVAEYFHNFDNEQRSSLFKNSLSFGLEWITFGHNFTINVTNARGFGEMQYIALNQSDWLQGQFRLGFTITRTFNY